jgi:hypothetical protein
MLQHEKLKTLQQITGVVINFFQNNQSFTSGPQENNQKRIPICTSWGCAG